MQDALNPIEPDRFFQFECSPEMTCFNTCCRDLVQALTPYDVLRLRQGLGLSSGRFLEQFTQRHAGPGSGLPVVTLRPFDARQRACPFLTPDGCRIYPHRPASCRIYPITRALRRSHADGRIRESFYVLREPHCRGFTAVRAQTVRQWLCDQGLDDYLAENDRLLEIIACKRRLHPGPLTLAALDRLMTALYDLDRFREQLRGSSLPEASALLAASAEAAAGDDLALLGLALEWAKGFLQECSELGPERSAERWS